MTNHESKKLELKEEPESITPDTIREMKRDFERQLDVLNERIDTLENLVLQKQSTMLLI